jgi:hypothetical protein
LLSAEDWSESDAQLLADEEFKAKFAKYSKPCSTEALERTVKSLTDLKHTVKVCESSDEALEYLSSLLKDGESVSNGTSATLEQIGFIEYLKSQDSRINNFKGKAAAAAAAGNMGESFGYLAQGALADWYFSSVSAVSEDGGIFAADMTGTRVAGFMAAKRLVVVLGSNKIVENEAEANSRLWDYQLKLESARVRVAYGSPASAVMNNIAIKSSNPFYSRITVVIVKQPLGF